MYTDGYSTLTRMKTFIEAKLKNLDKQTLKD